MNKSLIFKIFIFLILLYSIDQLVGLGLKKLYFSQKAGAAYRTTYAIDSTTAEILVFGSSRANHHYVPEVFEEGLSMSFYNTGRDGNGFLFSYAVFKAILTRYTPKIVIFDITPGELQFKYEGYERLSSLLPYYSSHKEIRKIVNLRSSYEKYKLFSSIYPFNSTLLKSFVFNLNSSKKLKDDRKGYLPLQGKIGVTNLIKYEYANIQLDTNIIQALDSISKLCFDKKIKLFICDSPFYFQTQKTKIDTLLTKLAKKNNFKYMDFSNDPYFIKHTELFRDRSHLNNEGAIIYSSLVLDSITFYCGINY